MVLGLVGNDACYSKLSDPLKYYATRQKTKLNAYSRIGQTIAE